MAHEYKKEADASHAKKLKSYGATTSSTADKLDDKDDATNWAGFRALNTNKQAGMAPLNKKASMSEETNPRIMRKKGGRVHGAESLKRLDKAGRKSKAAGGVPTPAQQQEAFDKTTRTAPGKMPQGITRAKGGKIQDYESRSHESQADQGKRPWEGHKKGGRVAKAAGGSFLDDLGELGNHLGNLFLGDDEAAAAPARRAAPRHRAPVRRTRITEVEHPVEHGIMAADHGPMRSADVQYGPPMPRGEMGPEMPRQLGAPDEGGMRDFLSGQGVSARPAPAPVSDSSMADPFYQQYLYRKRGGKVGHEGHMNKGEKYGAARTAGETKGELDSAMRALKYGNKKKAEKELGRAQGHTRKTEYYTGRASGGGAFEGSAKDEREDKKLEKKYGMSHKEWEASDLDKKHDRQESMKGLRSGGRAKRASGGGAFDDYMGGSSEGSSRKGSSGKGKTTVNIMIGQPQGGAPAGGIDPMLMAALAGGAGGPPPGVPQQLPPPAPPGGAPGGAPPPAAMMPPPAPPQGPPPGAGAGGPPMMRKDGGKVQVPYRKPGRKGDYPAMDFGSGGGFGRKQKIDAYGDQQGGRKR